MRRLPGGFFVSLRHCCFALDYGQAYSRLAMLMQASFCSRSIVALTNTPSFQNDNLHKKLALLAPLAPVGLTFPTLTRQHKRPCPLCFSARAASSFQISASREKNSASREKISASREKTWPRMQRRRLQVQKVQVVQVVQVVQAVQVMQVKKS